MSCDLLSIRLITLELCDPSKWTSSHWFLSIACSFQFTLHITNPTLPHNNSFYMACNFYFDIVSNKDIRNVNQNLRNAILGKYNISNFTNMLHTDNFVTWYLLLTNWIKFRSSSFDHKMSVQGSEIHNHNFGICTQNYNVGSSISTSRAEITSTSD